jgi:hypothetical protein
VETHIGWNKYAVLDIRFKNQVVGVVRDAAEIKSDSLKAVQIMKEIISEAEKNTNDSTKIQLPQPEEKNGNIESPVLEDIPAENNNINDDKPATKVITSGEIVEDKKPVLKKEISKENNKVTKQSTSNKRTHVVPKKLEKKQKTEQQRVPKAVMPPKSDY